MDYTGWAIFHTVVFYLLEIEGGGSNGCGATKGEKQKRGAAKTGNEVSEWDWEEDVLQEQMVKTRDLGKWIVHDMFETAPF